MLNASVQTSKLLFTIQSKNFQNAPCPLDGFVVSTSARFLAIPSGFGSSYSISAATASNLSASLNTPPQGIALSFLSYPLHNAMMIWGRDCRTWCRAMGSEAGEPGALYRKAFEKMNWVSLRASKGILWMDVARRRRMSSEMRRLTSWYCCSGVASFSDTHHIVSISSTGACTLRGELPCVPCNINFIWLNFCASDSSC